MSHEISDTFASPVGGAINYSGITGAPLPPVWPFEQMIYSGIPNAAAAAEARSHLFGQLIEAIKTQSPQARQLGLPLPFVPQLSPGLLEEGQRHAH